MSQSAPGVILIVVVVTLVTIPGASALVDPPPGAPENFTGEYDTGSQTIVLSWEPPAGNVAYSYNVYRDGELVNKTHETEYSEQLEIEGNLVASLYFVTAVLDNNGHEGPPSGPFIIIENPICEPVIISINPDADPPVGIGINHACIEGLKRSVERLISDSPYEFDFVEPEDLI